ncbi:helix-turn-helix domain-containing protein [Paenibacillus sp. FSL R10-2771]|uniref:helix-turn-helix domain-containing protein n=1 Tax=Paenibacillus sp. FSL R10-2771 TaxID=2954693 RepID=UPI0030F5D35C
MAVGKYKTHVEPKLLLIEAWARDGLTDLKIAERLGISEASFYKYRNEHEEFTEALKNGKEIIDTMVENALLKAALGYEYEERKITDDTIERTKKYAQPNTTALIFWLKNRKPQQWRDKQELGIEGELNIKVSLPKGLTPDADN